MKAWFKVLLVIAFVLLLMILFAGCAEQEEFVPIEYEILSVQSYIKTETNGYGGIFRQDIVYQITYLDNDGNVQILTEFNPLEYGNKLKVGDTNKLVQADRYEYHLYLTRETYDKLTIKIGE